MTARCHLVYALAPEGSTAREANDLLNESTAVGFEAQIAFTLEQYRGVRLEELAAAEPDDPRYWWKRRNR